MEFKIRCSAIGQIMTNSRSKSESLSQTTKTYCQTWLKEQLYKTKKEFSSKQTEKGNIMEDESIDFISDQLGYGMLLKNETFYDDEFMKGTPDLVLANEIIDVKNSWDCFTFPIFENDVPNKSYWWQLQGYMSLTGRDKAKLIYVLSNTPDNLIEREAYYWSKNNGYEELDNDVFLKFHERMTYDDIPDNLKIKVFEIERDNSAIEKINSRVLECREYINNLLEK